MQEICGFEIFIELSPTEGMIARAIQKYKFQTKNIPFKDIIKIVSNVFNEIHNFNLSTNSYLNMKQCIYATLTFHKNVCIKIENLKSQTEFYEVITNVKALQRSLKKIYYKTITQKFITRDDYLIYFYLNLKNIVDQMQKDLKNNSKYINKYIANIKTIDYLKYCDVSNLDDCIDYYDIEKTKTKEIQKYKMYREFLSIRKNRRDEINYYLTEKERCEKKKIIY